MKEELSGGCLCGEIRYKLKTGFRLKPYACHCTDCHKRTGSAFSLHMLFMLTDLDIQGAEPIAKITQPSGSVSNIFGCPICGCSIYAVNSTRPAFGSLRMGSIDGSENFTPAAHIWVKSKQPWITIPDGAPTIEEQPCDPEEWIEFLRADSDAM